MHLFRRLVAPVLSLAALSGCGGGDLVLPNEGLPASVAKVAGDQQTAAILEPAAESLVVMVKDRFGNPVSGAEVVWAPSGVGRSAMSSGPTL